MIKSEAEAVIERIRKELEKNGVSFGFDQVTTTPNFGCDLDHSVAQVSEAPENLVELILIHDTGLWRFLEGSEVHHCGIKNCKGKLFGMPIVAEPRSDDSYTIQFRAGRGLS
ncbi:hypothetical protein GEV39_09570 [Pseudomonas sp. NY5710]|uniref:hypothetical protein n=1 Tax=Pseudomonas sp. NY5710 TaxID=2662033 RepID=UPI00156EBBC6|nr:hypothetical protein [Pseudomonas sp. NY5710]QKL01631.1 hypothetical protein GEV39_09570 [Pseudomonas sp. NY5710]